MAEQGPRHFLPWVRQGSAAGIVNADSLTANQPAKVSLPVTLKFAELSAIAQLQLYGPADVTAIDPRQIVRTEPRPFTTDYPYNLFPSIEFDRPDFPWLFTPASAGANERLRPWLCLVVVKKQPRRSARAQEQRSIAGAGNRCARAAGTGASRSGRKLGMGPCSD
jgi:hypothetical protein